MEDNGSVTSPEDRLKGLNRQLRWTWAAIAVVAGLFASLWIARWTGVDKWTEVADLFIKVGGVVAVIYVYVRHQRKRHDLDVEHLKQQIKQQEARHELDVQLLKVQGQAAVDRGKLALNVELRVEVTPHNGGFFIRPTAIVKNASSKPFRVPGVYLTGRLVPRDVSPKYIDWEALIGCEALRTKNTADYGTVMVQLAPEETEQFTTWFYVSPELIAKYPSVVIRVDVLGAEEKANAFADKAYRARFVQWMNDHGAHSYSVFRSWPAGKFADLAKAGKPLPGGRCLMLPPATPDATPHEVDIDSTSDWRGFLDDDTMMWDRYVIVPLEATPNQAST